MLTEAPVLPIFDPSRPTKVSADASAFALGAALFQHDGQDWKVVAYSSRVLTDTERRYAQIEKEALGIVFGCEKFNEFVLGRKILVETDHQPLIALAKKNLGELPPRLQRLFLRLLKFEFDLQFVPGKKLVIADTLSRISCESQLEESSTDVEIHANAVLSTLVGSRTLGSLRTATSNDPVLQEAINCLEAGKPILGELKAVMTELSVVNGVLLKGSKVVIPTAMRKEILKRIHHGHLGLNKCRARARSLVYWPGMNADITELIRQCETCQVFAYRQQNEPLHTREVPENPWGRVGADLFELARRHYLVVYDAYSNFPEVEELQDVTANGVIAKLSAIFSRHGIPLEVCTDGGPQFSAKEFKDFAARYDFIHTVSSPRYPRSNGLAEKGVQVVKRLLQKAQATREDFWLGLLSYRTAPLEGGRSPSELLMGRGIRTLVPDFSSEPAPPVQKHAQNLQKGRHLGRLQPGDTVRILNNGKWVTKARVQSYVAPRSYSVITEDGRTFRRNRLHLLKTCEKYVQGTNDDDHDDDSEVEDEGLSESPRPDNTDEHEARTPHEYVQQTQRLNGRTSGTSRRTRRPPRRLSYDETFQQIA